MDDNSISVSRAADDAEKALIVAAIRKAAADNGGLPPNEMQFRRMTGYSAYTWRGKYWVRWSEALQDAGFPNPRTLANDDEYLLSRLAAAARHYRHAPSFVELTHYGRSHRGFPSQMSFARVFQTKHNMIDRLLRWAESKPDMADIAGFCSRSRNGSPLSGELPAVYLLRSGEFFKIGWTSTLIRRIEDLQTGLPEPAELLHVIRTPDPRGTEARWHRRFAEKRVRGEWFKLTSEDVAAFCSETRP